jgi:hypothetical protein
MIFVFMFKVAFKIKIIVSTVLLHEELVLRAACDFIPKYRCFRVLGFYPGTEVPGCEISNREFLFMLNPALDFPAA